MQTFPTWPILAVWPTAAPPWNKLRYKTPMVTVTCTSCGHENEFDQPHPYHAGFSNQGFLYNDEGNLTLVWSSFDPGYEAVMGRKHPWTLTTREHRILEDALRPAPSGGSWRFANPARCMQCADSIGASITSTIYYLLYLGSIVTDLDSAHGRLNEFLSPQSG
jgi:hypothetical protein